MTDRNWHRVAATDDLPVGGVMMAKAGDTLVAVVRTEDGVCALDNTCPHLGAPLGNGRIEDGKLVCPWHGRAFDLATGECEGFAESIKAFDAEIRDDGIYVAAD